VKHVNVSTLTATEAAVLNSGWLARLHDDADLEEIATFIRASVNSDEIDEDEFEKLVHKYLIEIVGWDEGFLMP